MKKAKMKTYMVHTTDEDRVLADDVVEAKSAFQAGKKIRMAHRRELEIKMYWDVKNERYAGKTCIVQVNDI